MQHFILHFFKTSGCNLKPRTYINHKRHCVATARSSVTTTFLCRLQLTSFTFLPRELTMNFKKIIIASAFIATAASAYAENRYPPEQPFVSTKTRAEVIAEMQDAGGDLGRKNYEATFNPANATASSKTRAEVLAELKEAGINPSRNRDTYSSQ